MKIGSLYIPIKADTAGLKTGLASAHSKVSTFATDASRKFGAVTDSVFSLKGAVVALAGTAGMYKLISASREWIALANKQEQAEARLAAVVKATGGAAGFSAAEMKRMASGLQQITTVGDETIIAGEAILATFKQIHGEAFTRATKSALDLAEVMGTSLNSAVMQLGKALNDPVANLGALSRAGIQFTKDQKAVIKTLWETNQQAKAQDIILTELESQFGGTAVAAAKTFGGAQKQAQNALGDLKEQLGFVITKNEYFIDLMHQAKEKAEEWGKTIADNREELQQLVKVKFISWLDTGKAAIKAMTPILMSIRSELAYMWQGFQSLPSWVKEVGIVGALVGGMKGKVIIGGLLHLTTTFKNVYEGFSQALKGNIKWSELATMNAQELAKKLAELNQEVSSAGDDWAAINNEIATTTETIKDNTVVVKENATAHHQASEDMIDDMYSYRHWWDETTNSMSDDWAAINDEIEGKFKKTLGPEGEAVQTADEGFGKIGDLAETQLTAVFQGEFTSIGGFFKDTLNSMYSMFTSWVSQIAAKKIVFPVVMGVVGTAGSALAGQGTSGGMGSGFSFSSLTGWGGAQDWLASTLGNSNILGLQDIGMGITGMNPALFGGLAGGLGGVALSLLTGGNAIQAGLSGLGAGIGSIFGPVGSLAGGLLGSIVGGLFGHKKTPAYRYRGKVFGGFDSSGNFGVDPSLSYDPTAAHSADSYVGTYYSAGGRNTDSAFDQQVLPFSAEVDSMIGDVIQGYGDWFGNLADTLPKAMKTEFLDKIKSIPFGFDYAMDVRNPTAESMQASIEAMMTSLNEQLWGAYGNVLSDYTSAGIQEQMAQYGITIDKPNLDTSSMENFQASVMALNDAFTPLITAVNAVAPAFDELLGNLSSATSQYFGGFQSIDAMIANAGGVDYRGVDAQWQADTYKYLFDNAVANGSSTAMQLGLQYGQSLVAMAPYANKDYDLAGALEDIRKQMVDIQSPEDFYTSIQDSVNGFVTGVQGGLDNLVAAINNLHPELNMDNIKLNITVVADQPSGTAVGEVGAAA